jgi:mannose-6-phosphate isomerase-like protein (cupin superfamily)
VTALPAAQSPTAAISLDAALAQLPGPGGARSAPLFSHGTLRVKLYAPRGHDPQTPHGQDEAYVAAQGSAQFWDGERRHAVAPGAFLFAAAGRPHRFEAMSDDFAVWVIFYGPEGGEAAA